MTLSKRMFVRFSSSCQTAQFGSNGMLLKLRKIVNVVFSSVIGRWKVPSSFSVGLASATDADVVVSPLPPAIMGKAHAKRARNTINAFFMFYLLLKINLC